MADPWMPGLRHDPGSNAGYRAGRNRMWMVVDHWTAGVNSYDICKNRGLCQFLLPKVGVPWQFAEVDAVCWHAGSLQYGNYNDDGPGLEVERLGGHEPLTADQTHWLGRINAWLASERGVPNVHYWGPRFAWHAADFHGHVNHAQVHPNDDGLSCEEWASLGTDNDGGFTVGQMDDIAAWENDTRAHTTREVDDLKAELAQWENDTRAYVDKKIRESEQRIIAAINAG